MADKGKLGTEPYKGVRDFYPEDQFILNYLFSTMRKVAESYGYSEYSASILEPSELYRDKTSEEIVNEQTYSFKDRGERDVTLRPEMTPTLARMIAAKRRELPFPLRWYSIPNVFRYERPQRGRLREHFQLNCDLFGVKGAEAEIEIISLAHRIMTAFGATEKDFVIKINNRDSLNKLFEKHELNAEQAAKMLALIDRKDKIDNFDEEAEKIAGKKFLFDEEESEAVATIRGELRNLGITNTVYEPTLARGFLYYTGSVFEVFDLNPENRRALFGGGRYDNLLSIFGVDPVPAVGFGMGDVTMRDFLEVRGLLPEYRGTPDVYLCTVSKEALLETELFAERLREKGVRVAVNLAEKKMGDQIKIADKQKIPYIVVIGEDELKTGKFKLKNLKTGEEQVLSEQEIPGAVRM